MHARSLGWAARIVDPEALDQARALAAALGLVVVLDEPGKLMATTQSGDLVEWLTPERAEPPHLFDGQQTALGFAVDDLDAARDALDSAGFTSITEPAGDGTVRFCHVRGPAGVAYALIQTG